MIFLQVLMILMLIKHGYLDPIVQDVPVCRETNQSIDLDMPCQDKDCVAYKNIIYQMSGEDDVFNYIYTIDFQKIIVYSNNGRVYRTECEIIHSFDIISKQLCSSYVGVNFQLKFAQTQGYLSKQMIIRLKIKNDTICRFSSDQNNFANYNSEFSLYKKDDKVAIAARNDSTIGIDFEKQNVLVENYERVFGISISNLIRDASFIIIELLVLVFILYNAFQQRRSIFQTVKDMSVFLIIVNVINEFYCLQLGIHLLQLYLFQLNVQLHVQLHLQLHLHMLSLVIFLAIHSYILIQEYPWSTQIYIKQSGIHSNLLVQMDIYLDQHH